MDDQIIKTVQGEIIKQDEGVQILEINDCTRQDINENSKRLIQKMKQKLSNNSFERQIFQKHCLTLVTCTECKANYGAKQFKFWVLGQNKQIYAPDYPGTGCCCTIL